MVLSLPVSRQLVTGTGDLVTVTVFQSRKYYPFECLENILVGGDRMIESTTVVATTYI